MSRPEFDSDNLGSILLIWERLGESPDDPSLLARAILRGDLEGEFRPDYEEDLDFGNIRLSAVGRNLWSRYLVKCAKEFHRFRMTGREESEPLRPRKKDEREGD